MYREKLERMLQLSKNRKHALEGKDMVVLIDMMQIIIPEKKI